MKIKEETEYEEGKVRHAEGKDALREKQSNGNQQQLMKK